MAKTNDNEIAAETDANSNDTSLPSPIEDTKTASTSEKEIETHRAYLKSKSETRRVSGITFFEHNTESILQNDGETIASLANCVDKASRLGCIELSRIFLQTYVDAAATSKLVKCVVRLRDRDISSAVRDQAKLALNRLRVHPLSDTIESIERQESPFTVLDTMQTEVDGLLSFTREKYRQQLKEFAGVNLGDFEENRRFFRRVNAMRESLGLNFTFEDDEYEPCIVRLQFSKPTRSKTGSFQVLPKGTGQKPICTSTSFPKLGAEVAENET